jgi:hypothetical protein
MVLVKLFLPNSIISRVDLNVASGAGAFAALCQKLTQDHKLAPGFVVRYQGTVIACCQLHPIVANSCGLCVR